MRETKETLLAYHVTNGCINIQKLANRTRIVLKTIDEVYELEIGTASRSVVLMASNVRFEDRDKYVVAGSNDRKSGIFLHGIIGEGLCAVLRPRRGPAVRTHPVLSARITGENYNYELWND